MSTLESLAAAALQPSFFSTFHGPSWSHHTAICFAKALELGFIIHRTVVELGAVTVLTEKNCSQAPKTFLVQLKATHYSAKLASCEATSLGPHKAGQEAHMLSTCNCKSFPFGVAECWSGQPAAGKVRNFACHILNAKMMAGCWPPACHMLRPHSSSWPASQPWHSQRGHP